MSSILSFMVSFAYLLWLGNIPEEVTEEVIVPQPVRQLGARILLKDYKDTDTFKRHCEEIVGAYKEKYDKSLEIVDHSNYWRQITNTIQFGLRVTMTPKGCRINCVIRRCDVLITRGKSSKDEIDFLKCKVID